jgi:hypothetical protein
MVNFRNIGQITFYYVESAAQRSGTHSRAVAMAAARQGIAAQAGCPVRHFRTS